MTPSTTARQVRGVTWNSVVIARAPDVVFDYITDMLREPEWNDQLRRVEMLTDEPRAVGTRYRADFGSGVGESIIEVVGFEPPYSWRSTSTSTSRRLDVQVAGSITATTSGSLVSLRTRLLPHGRLRLARPFLSRAVRARCDRYLTHVKALLEAAPDGAPPERGGIPFGQ